MRARIFVGEALRSVTANISTTVAATLTVLIGMFLLGLFIALGTWVLSWTDHVKEGAQVRVFFVQDVNEQQVNGVNALLAQNPDVADFTFVSAEDALRRMRDRYPDMTANLAANPFPPSFEVQPVDAERIDAIVAALEPLPPGVDKVSYPKTQTDRILQVARIIGSVFLVGAVVLLVAATLLIANTTRLSIFSRRREIEVMKLVGATNWFVRGPFVLEGLICGLIGSILAVFLLLVAKEFALESISGRLDTSDDVRALSFPLMALILVGVSLVVGALGSGITLRRFLKI